MAMKILVAECTSCEDCIPVCPTTSIFVKGGIVKINKDTCTECEGTHDAPQCVLTCPGGDTCIVYI